MQPDGEATAGGRPLAVCLPCQRDSSGHYCTGGRGVDRILCRTAESKLNRVQFRSTAREDALRREPANPSRVGRKRGPEKDRRRLWTLQKMVFGQCMVRELTAPNTPLTLAERCDRMGRFFLTVASECTEDIQKRAEKPCMRAPAIRGISWAGADERTSWPRTAD